MKDLHAIDRKLSQLSREIDFYPHLTPLNHVEEEKKFFDFLGKDKAYNPVYGYSDRNFDTQREWLVKAASGIEDDGAVGSLFLRHIDFMLTQLDLLGCGDEDLAEMSAVLFGLPAEATLEAALNILTESKKEGYVFPEENVTPEEMASVMRKELMARKIAWQVKVTDHIVPKMTVSGKHRAIYVNASINYTPEEIERLKVHEIDVHVTRGENGAAQEFKMFAEGIAGYNETEEGLAIFCEHAAGVLKADTRQMKLYAARAIAADLSIKGSFYEAFEALREFFPDYMAYRLVERSKRGMRDTSAKGGITKGSHYISGWKKVSDFVEEGGDISILYVGKISLDDVEVTKKLLDEGVLKPPKYLPVRVTRDDGRRT